MKAMKFLLPIATAGAISLAAPALAQDSTTSTIASHLYIGANAGEAHWRSLCPVAATCDDTNATLGVFAGYQINRIFSAEAAFRNYGEAKSPNASIKGRGWEITGLAAWPVVHALSVYGRLGMFRSVLKGDGAPLGPKETTTRPTFPVPLQPASTPNVPPPSPIH